MSEGINEWTNAERSSPPFHKAGNGDPWINFTPEVPSRFKGPWGGCSQLTFLLRALLSLPAEVERGAGSRRTLWSLTGWAGKPRPNRTTSPTLQCDGVGEGPSVAL